MINITWYFVEENNDLSIDAVSLESSPPEKGL